MKMLHAEYKCPVYILATCAPERIQMTWNSGSVGRSESPNLYDIIFDYTSLQMSA